jgi:hypothetical protein
MENSILTDFSKVKGFQTKHVRKKGVKCEFPMTGRHIYMGDSTDEWSSGYFCL